MVTITEFDPARTGWGLAQNAKIRKHAVALSILVPYLLDKRGGKCESGNTCENEFVSSFCTMAAAKRPPAACSFRASVCKSQPPARLASGHFTYIVTDGRMEIGMDGSATLAVHLRLTDKVHDEVFNSSIVPSACVHVCFFSFHF